MSAIESTRGAARPASDIEAQVQAEADAIKQRQRRDFIWKSILAHFVVLLFVLFAAFPIYFLITAAFRSGQALYSTNLQLIPTDLTLDNFDHMINHTELLTWLRNSLIVALATTVLSVCLATPAAYAFSRWQFPGRNAILGFMLAIQAFPAILALIAIFVIFKQLNLLDNLLGLVLAYSSGGLVFSIWNTKGYFDTIPPDLEEAAMVDGATPSQAFFRIILPLARPVIAVTALLGFMAGWGEYIVAQTVLFSEEKYTSMVGLITLQTDYSLPWGWFAVGSIFAMIPVMALFMSLQRQLIGGLTLGGVKG
jgi:arabinogalactan oligomer / maltooligosaccharide transport system permease protein